MGEPSCEGRVKVGACWPTVGTASSAARAVKRGTAAIIATAATTSDKRRYLFTRNLLEKQGLGTREQQGTEKPTLGQGYH
jgi:hypothetical protein